MSENERTRGGPAAPQGARRGRRGRGGAEEGAPPRGGGHLLPEATVLSSTEVFARPDDQWDATGSASRSATCAHQPRVATGRHDEQMLPRSSEMFDDQPRHLVRALSSQAVRRPIQDVQRSIGKQLGQSPPDGHRAEWIGAAPE